MTKKFFDTFFFWVVVFIVCGLGYGAFANFSFNDGMYLFCFALAVVAYFVAANLLKQRQHSDNSQRIEEKIFPSEIIHHKLTHPVLCPKCNSECVTLPADISCPICGGATKKQLAQGTPAGVRCAKCNLECVMHPAAIACPVCDALSIKPRC